MKNRALLIINILIIILMLSSAPVYAQQESSTSSVVNKIAIAEFVTVKGSELSLADIAQIDTPDSTLAAHLQAISLGYAPNVGMMRKISREAIINSITSAGVSAKSFDLDIPSIIVVKRAGYTIDSAQLQELVEQATLTELRNGGAVARLIRLDLPEQIVVPVGETSIAVLTSGVRNLFTPFIVSIEITVDRRVVKRLSVTAQAEAFANLMVAQHPINAGERVSLDDLQWQVTKITQPLASYLRDPQDLTGIASRARLEVGQPLTKENTFHDIVVKLGSTVRILGKFDQLVIEVPGQARANGRVGERIQVKNLLSGNLIQATVLNENMVMVSY